MKTENEHYNLMLIKWANDGYPPIDLSTEYWRNQTIALVHAYKNEIPDLDRYKSRVSELERENERLELLIKDNEKWIRIYKSSGEDVAKQIERLEKEVETLREALSLIRDMDDDIETEHGDPGEIAIRALAEHLDKNSTGE